MSDKSNLFGFNIVPLKSWLVMPVYISGYTIINMGFDTSPEINPFFFFYSPL